jgi:DNA-binding SARP family transcriptional activator
LAGSPARVYLLGKVQIESPGQLVDESRFPGRQGRRAFAFLALNRERPVSREELADAVWGEDLPPAWSGALSALVSKLRCLPVMGPSGPTIERTAGGYHLRLPPDAKVDHEQAIAAVDAAEGALRNNDAASALAAAVVAVAITRLSMLGGEDAPWIEHERTALRQLRVRSLAALSDAALATGDSAMAVQAAEEARTLEPYRDTGYQRLMRAHSATGNRAEALRTYAECRAFLAAELGVDPAPETQALYLDLLRLG